MPLTRVRLFEVPDEVWNLVQKAMAKSKGA